MREAPLLLDVSRLIWRQWTRRLPTGIDRVCLAYLEHFRSRARAVVQFRGFRRILDEKGSERLFELLLNGSNLRIDLAMTLVRTAIWDERSTASQIYLNVGHTGLNSPYLKPWLDQHQLRPVLFIHDLIPITHPEYCREGEAERHEERIEMALRTARGIIVNSAATQANLTRFANQRGLPMPPCLVAWLGVDVAPAAVTDNSVTRERPYFVTVGTIEARKNHLLLLSVWADLVAKLADQAPDLIVIGQRGWEAEEAITILDNPGPLRPHLVELSRCDDHRMTELLTGARALLMPSFVEGYGLPLVEALQLGVPVVASNLPVFQEIAGDIPTFLDPHDRAGWLAAILEHAGGTEHRRTDLASYRAPDWDSHFDLVDEFLEKL